MLGDRPAAEDVVQEAFCGLYRRWHTLADTDKALSYVRSSVINGCRSVLRRRSRAADSHLAGDPPGESAESAVLVSEEHRQVLAAIRRRPDRQREALVLRFYLDLDHKPFPLPNWAVEAIARTQLAPVRPEPGSNFPEPWLDLDWSALRVPVCRLLIAFRDRLRVRH